MEKLVYAVWKNEGASSEDLRDRFVRDASRELTEAGARWAALSIADSHVRFAQRARITHLEQPIDAVVTFWLDSHLQRTPCEALIDDLVARSAGYLVLESQPTASRGDPTRPGERAPGVNTITLLERPDHLDGDAFLEIWQGSHTEIALDALGAFSTVQNVVVRALTKDAPPWAAIVEEGFPRDAFVDPRIFYNAGDSEERLEENRRRLIESCDRFVARDRVEFHPFSRYLLTA